MQIIRPVLFLAFLSAGLSAYAQVPEPAQRTGGSSPVTGYDEGLQTLAIIPKPVSAQIQSGSFTIDPLVVLVADTSDSPSTNFFNAIMFGLIFLVLAVLCEYLAEMRSEVKRRPLYVVQGELQSNVMLANAETRNVVSHEEKVETIAPPERANP